jgi:hypothetical protein
MLKKTLILHFIICVLILNSCKKVYESDLNPIIINELMAVNYLTAADQNGQFDDWIELRNLSSSAVNISGYFLSDSKSNPEKWVIPQGTTIAANGYLIFWADKDTTQAGLHTNFKLSSSGENLVLSKPDKTISDKVTYPAQSFELSYSRRPDGTGDFRWQNATYNGTNGY